jgi:hypothetical protein
MIKDLGITHTPDVKVLIRGLASTTVFRLIDGNMTCGKLKSELGVSRMMIGGKFLKDDHTFVNNDIIHVMGRLRGGMEVNFDQSNTVKRKMCFLRFIFRFCSPTQTCIPFGVVSGGLYRSLCMSLLVVSLSLLGLGLGLGAGSLSLFVFVSLSLFLSLLFLSWYPSLSLSLRHCLCLS